MILEPFAGPGGWDEGLRQLGRSAIGLEHDHAACRTRVAAGHRVARADVASFPLGHLGEIEGLIASPPCPQFSAAGKGLGTRLTAELYAAVTDALAGRPRLAAHTRTMARKLRAEALATTKATRAEASARAWAAAREAALSVQPARYVAACRPRWIAMEQVPAVLPLWRHYARALEGHGYRCWAGLLNAADFGVPQTRTRAFLLAHRDRQPHPPEPTHGRSPAPSLFGQLAPWVSMAEALGWTDPDRLAGRVGFGRRDDRGDSPDGLRERDFRPSAEPALVLTEKARSWTVRTGTNSSRHSRDRWHLTPGGWRANGEANRRPRDVDTEPAPTMAFGHDSYRWAWARPSTTVMGDPRIAPPGHKGSPADGGPRQMDNAIRLEVWEAGVLQGFRPDYPWQGGRSKQFEQVGNAVPPPVAAAILAGLL